MALLTVYDDALVAGKLTKSGNRHRLLRKDKDEMHPGQTKCFYVVRTDGTRIDFSLKQALNAASQSKT